MRNWIKAIVYVLGIVALGVGLLLACAYVRWFGLLFFYGLGLFIIFLFVVAFKTLFDEEDKHR